MMGFLRRLFGRHWPPPGPLPSYHCVGGGWLGGHPDYVLADQRAQIVQLQHENEQLREAIRQIGVHWADSPGKSLPSEYADWTYGVGLAIVAATMEAGCYPEAFEAATDGEGE